MRKARLLLAVAAACAVLYGCADQAGQGREFTPVENSIYVSRSGMFSSALVTDYDKDYYVQEELQQFLTEAVAEFNNMAADSGSKEPESGNGEAAETEMPPVTLQSCKLENGVASSVFSYKTADDLLRFAAETGDDSHTFTFLDAGTVADGIVKGYVVDGTFVNTKGEAVDAKEVSKESKLYVVCAQGAGTIQTEGPIVYMSEGVTLVDEYTAAVPDKGKSYIIFK